MTFACPNCGGAEFEERGDVRCYTPVIVVEKRGELRFEADPDKSWIAPIETYERDDDPAYSCLSCQNEFDNPTQLVKS